MIDKLHFVEDIIDEYDLFLVDIWGVISESQTPYPGVVEALSFLASKKPVCFVSNSPRLRYDIKERLNNFGIDAQEEQIFSSGEIASMLIENSINHLDIEDPVIYLLTDDYFGNIYSSTKWNFTENLSDANILVVTAQMQDGDDLEQYNELLDIAANRGLLCICPNPDTIIPSGNLKKYCPGFIVRNYKGKVIYTGKPYQCIFEPVLAQYPHITKDKVLMIGDTLDMDILGASNVGIKSALVHTGNARLLRNKYGIAEGENMHLLRQHIDIQPSIFLSLQLKAANNIV